MLGSKAADRFIYCGIEKGIPHPVVISKLLHMKYLYPVIRSPTSFFLTVVSVLVQRGVFDFLGNKPKQKMPCSNYYERFS